MFCQLFPFPEIAWLLLSISLVIKMATNSHCVSGTKASLAQNTWDLKKCEDKQKQ